MKEKEFINWMSALCFKESTINSRLSNLRRIEEAYGNLDDMIQSDKFSEIKESLNYTSVDANNHAKPKHKIHIDGDLRTGSATLKNALMLYKKAFETFEANNNSQNIASTTRNFKAQFENIVKFLSKLNITKNNHTFNNKETVKQILQIPILTSLSTAFPDFEWEMEYKININVKDRIDIIGRLKTDPDLYQIIIELDNERGDQISKKFVSRMALTTDRNTGYITLCYPSSNCSAKAGKQETNKYSSYMNLLSEVLQEGTNFDKLYAFIKL